MPLIPIVVVVPATDNSFATDNVFKPVKALVLMPVVSIVVVSNKVSFLWSQLNVKLVS